MGEYIHLLISSVFSPHTTEPFPTLGTLWAGVCVRLCVDGLGESCHRVLCHSRCVGMASVPSPQASSPHATVSASVTEMVAVMESRLSVLEKEVALGRGRPRQYVRAHYCTAWVIPSVVGGMIFVAMLTFYLVQYSDSHVCPSP